MASEALFLLIGKIISVVENEAFLIRGVHNEVSELRRELESMRSFLEEANDNRALTRGQKTWVANVREVAFVVEDILDEFMYKMNKRRMGGRFRILLYKVVHSPTDLWVRHQIAINLQKINRMIKAIPERSQRYRVNRIQEGTSSQEHQRKYRHHNEYPLFIKEDDIVGIEKAKEQLLDWIMDRETQRTVISVTGMGGVGKTTLVSQVCNSQIVKQNFDWFTWVTVSQTYMVEDLLRSMVKEFYRVFKASAPSDLGSKSYRELVEIILEYLRSKRYLIVFDDVWNCNFWRDIQVALPDEGQGSRVMLTTRMQDIALSSFGVKTHAYIMEPLSWGDAWNLFCMKAFSSNQNRCCPPERKMLAQDLVTKCKGLPLAIVALGGVMSFKHLESDWRNVYNSLSWQLTHNPRLEDVKNILFLSFNDLPHQLKYCFLYCCLFPEDYVIKRKRLIRLWMAEGFVEKVKGLTPEEVAESYLMELISRSMLRVVDWNGAGRPKACKMHDLLRELALSTSEQEKFCSCSDGQAETKTGEIGARRLSIHMCGNKIESWNGMSKLRSLLVFAIDTIFPSLETLGRGFRLLRVLDLQNVPISNLPDKVVNLFNLRYLSLRGTMVKELPKFIGRLCNLETLDIRDSQIKVLPDGITKLQNLRHLIVYRYSNLLGFEYISGAQAPTNICCLRNLQVLACVQAKADLIKRIRNMTQLKRIGITKVREADGNDLCVAIQRMSLLHYLSVMVADETECLRMDTLSSPPPYLQTLMLVGKLEKVPCWFHSLQSLNLLCLHWSRLCSEDLLPVIGQLPSLGKLQLMNACGGPRLCFSTGFHKLTELFLISFPQLNGITIEQGVMPGLQFLWIVNCMQLKTLPHGIEHLQQLQVLNLLFVTNELKVSTYTEGNMKHPKVQHIPRINIHQQSSLPVGPQFELARFHSLPAKSTRKIKIQIFYFRVLGEEKSKFRFLKFVW